MPPAAVPHYAASGIATMLSTGNFVTNASVAIRNNSSTRPPMSNSSEKRCSCV